jgi:hypothetical protein
MGASEVETPDSEALELTNVHFEKFADWCERGALIASGSLVVQQVVEGAGFLKPSVVVGVFAAGILYYAAYKLMKKVK